MELMGIIYIYGITHISLNLAYFSSLIPLAPLSLVGFYIQPTKSLTFSRAPKGCQVKICWCFKLSISDRQVRLQMAMRRFVQVTGGIFF